jgi:AcrR family transcriptional regulator
LPLTIDRKALAFFARNEYSFHQQSTTPMTPPPPPSPRSTAKADPRVGDKREGILAAALDLFVERGFHGATVPEIAERAGVGAGTIYRYFVSKEALVNALYQQFKTEITDVVLKDFPVDKPARQMIHHLWSRLADFACGHERAYAFLELHHHADYLDVTSKAIEHRMIDLGVRLLQAAQLRGEVKQGDPMVLISVVHGAFVGMLRASWEGKLTLTPEAMTLGEQCAWEAIRA